MATKVEIISKEMIKPSSPTPTNLKLSFLDQIAPSFYVPLIFFYHHHQLILSPKQISQSLKQSLSKTLTIFYPLGGTVQENSSVDCSDSGAEFSEARVHARLSDIIQEANKDELNKLLPLESLGHLDENFVLKARLNFFDCGGVGLAVCLWHKLGDLTSFMAFLEAWATTCRGKTLISGPSFDLASFFPPKPLSETLDFIPGAGVPVERNVVTKRFVFSKEMIAKLKEMFNSTTGSMNSPTRVEAVSSYMWRLFIEAGKAKAGPQTPTLAAAHVVNLRPRKRTPFSQHLFGNCCRPAVALSTPEDDYSELVVKLRAAITSMDDDFIEHLGSEEYIEDQKRSSNSTVGFEICFFSSWVRFPVYNVDFGWGKPVWVCTTAVPAKNIVILMSTPCGEGIEAWVNLVQHDMKMFEKKHEQLIA